MRRKNKIKEKRHERLVTAGRELALQEVLDSAIDKEPQAEHSSSAKTLLWRRPGFLVRRLHQIHVAMFLEECVSHAITPVQYAVLTTLNVLPGLDQGSIGLEVGLDRTTTADVVKRLENNGLVSRRVHPEDKRARQVFLSAAGTKLVTDMYGDMTRSQERLLAPLTSAERAMFMQLLSTLVESNNQYSRTMMKSVV